MIAALYVQTDGCYYGLDGVDPWDEQRDAREYAGPWPVVAHPPCQRWGNYWFGSPSSDERFEMGDDGGCFPAALCCVREFGGIIEHPAGSRAWAAHDLPSPGPRGWQRGICGGWSCHVEQGHYGHRAPKATWLYAYGVDLPSLDWGASNASFTVEGMGRDERRATPAPFRDLLLSIARTAESEAA